MSILTQNAQVEFLKPHVAHNDNTMAVSRTELTTDI